MRLSPSLLSRALALLCIAGVGSGCVYHRHDVGLGATGTGVATDRQYYLLFGLVDVYDIDTRRLAPELTSYTVETQFGWTDLLLAPLLLPLTVTTRTVVVKT